MAEKTLKRLFFGFQVEAPWPTTLPKGRVVPEQSRHFTLAFLGNVDFTLLSKRLSSIPLPSFKIGKTGFFEKCLFLPEKDPRVVAWQGRWLEDSLSIENYHRILCEWLALSDKKPWLCHATIARAPFKKEEWNNFFQHLPFAITHLNLYESLPGLHYQPIWSFPFLAPFEEFEHTADIAFTIRGETIQQLFYNAFSALSWRFPPLLAFHKADVHFENLDDVIILLNECIGNADEQFGCPYKAISFHGNLKQKNDFMEWEMIVDV